MLKNNLITDAVDWFTGEAVETSDDEDEDEDEVAIDDREEKE